MSEAPSPGGWRELGFHWRVLLGCVLGMAIGVTGVIPYTSGIFLPHLSEAFGWSKAGISVGQSLQAYGTALAVPLVGAFVDRAGLRLPAGVGFAGFAACLFALSFMSGPIVMSKALFVSACTALARFRQSRVAIPTGQRSPALR